MTQQTAVLICDMQVDMVAMIPEELKAELVKNNEAVLNAARKANLLPTFIRVAFRYFSEIPHLF